MATTTPQGTRSVKPKLPAPAEAPSSGRTSPDRRLASSAESSKRFDGPPGFEQPVAQGFALFGADQPAEFFAALGHQLAGPLQDLIALVTRHAPHQPGAFHRRRQGLLDVGRRGLGNRVDHGAVIRDCGLRSVPSDRPIGRQETFSWQAHHVFGSEDGPVLQRSLSARIDWARVVYHIRLGYLGDRRGQWRGRSLSAIEGCSGMKIASLLSSATEMLCALGFGVVAGGDQPRMRLSTVGDRPAARHSIAHPGHRVERRDRPASARPDGRAERRSMKSTPSWLAACRPDLIVTQAQCDVCAVRYADVLAAVASRPSLAQTTVLALNPQSLADVIGDLERLGEATGTLSPRPSGCKPSGRPGSPPCGQATADSVAATRPRVAMVEWIEPLMFSGNWVPEIVALAGGRHDLTVAGQHSPYVEWEELLAYDPAGDRGRSLRFRSSADRCLVGNRSPQWPGWQEFERGPSRPGLCGRRQRLFQSPGHPVDRQFGAVGPSASSRPRGRAGRLAETGAWARLAADAG